MSGSKFTGSYLGIGLLLHSEGVTEYLMQLAEAVKAKAEEKAPVSDPSDAPYNKTAGRYKESFGTRLQSNRGKPEAVIYNDSPEAIRVEKGNANIEARHILVTALIEGIAGELL